MLNLSMTEQKQILGGEYICVIYDPSGNYYDERYFSTKAKAIKWGKKQTKNGGSYKVGYVAD